MHCMNVGKVYPRYAGMSSSLCEPEQLACYPSGVASLRKQHTNSQDTTASTAITAGDPSPSLDSAGNL